MKTLVRIVLPAAATLVFASGCAAKQVHAETPVAASLQPPQSHAPTPAMTPNTPTASSIRISDEILRACNIPDADEYFSFDSSRLTAFDDGPLNAVATCFSRGPLAGRTMRLVGHADPRGASEYNIMLGQSRADAVATYLEDRGLRSGSVTTTSRGAMDATGTDETGWAHDRRVDVLLGS